MNFFKRCKNGILHIEEISLNTIAKLIGTPCYVYSKNAIINQFIIYQQALKNYPHIICYAIKTNSNLAILNMLSKLGSGFDIVSGGELERVLMAGCDPSKIVFSGVAKRADEIIQALNVNIKCFNVESCSELQRINNIAKSIGKTAKISIRVNPNIDPKTHPYISTGLKDNKFGIPIKQAPLIYAYAKTLNFIKIIGINCHIGSQITNFSPILNTIDHLIELISILKNKQNIKIQHINLGGGLGVDYFNLYPPPIKLYIKKILNKLNNKETVNIPLIIEPGRSIAADAGILLTRIEYIKINEKKKFAIIDAGMNDIIRPSLYNAWQNIDQVDIRIHNDKGFIRKKAYYDIVGPICESSDFVGKSRLLSITEGDYLAIRSAGAYGFVMASNYNTRIRPSEIMVEENEIYLIRKKELLKKLLYYEQF
ncbi:Diaminopimelate decarboxylase [Candidatus Johnevansia muelleri]|uniref:Diaminopimelate decarboxylase n=1 Tax=Candidatus Johnevansia muelleri TaxID=1495769 RepID=A0A078KEU1_9GAMM|nr:Diaminopimelate decarboxylase [Candidatus Evansia muelleri]